jgi:hypothetical protein
MSQQLPGIPWIHIGECPFCVNGLCRIRCCDYQQGPHLFAMCDECEAIWLEPTTDSPKLFPDADQPQCPICSGSLYGPATRWAESQDLKGTRWEEAAIFDIPSADPPTEDFLTAEDYVGELDVPMTPEPSGEAVSNEASEAIVRPSSTVDAHPTGVEPDMAYGDDEPRPGC